MNHPNAIRMTILATAITAACTGVFAQDLKLFESHTLPDALMFEPRDMMGMQAKIDMIVKGPGDFHLRKSFEAGEPIELSPETMVEGGMPDGTYQYELRIMGIAGVAADRDSGKPAIAESLQPGFGAFTVLNGKLVSSMEEESPYKGADARASVQAAVTASSDAGENGTRQVIPEDLIVQGSLCVGFDCVNGESFGFDTIRMKENNTRIKFDDTSSSGSFPNNDWQLTANDSANGGLNKFSIENTTIGRIPFTIAGNAPSNSLWVANNGNIGLGTSTPALQAHIVDGNTPSLRLEQDGSSGFTAQTWDVAGNEANFFVRDVTNGSTLPFRIRPGAPTSAIDIAASGNVGLGTTSPSAPFHLVESSDLSSIDPHVLVENTNSIPSVRTMWEMQNNGGVVALFTNSDSNARWAMVNANTGTNFLINDIDSPNREFELDQDGNLTIEGEITTAGSCSAGCDRVFDPDYAILSIAQQVESMYSNRHLPNIGPTSESGSMNISRKVGGILNELEKAHIYIGQLHARIERLEQLIGQ